MYRRWLIVLALLFISGDLIAQTLEPRRWSHLPIDLNFVGAGTAYTFGDIFFDPLLQAEDVEMDLGVLVGSYIRTFDMFGKSARIEATVPYMTGRWHGLLEGVPTSVRRRGFGDARLRLSVNLFGAPALKGKEFAAFRAKSKVHTTVGVALQVFAPTGDYNSQWLINLGNNRWTLRPQLGVLHERGKWQFEATGSVFLHGDNNDFWKDTERTQKPLAFIQGHVIYTFRPGLWASFSTGYGYGGRNTVSGAPKRDERRVSYWAVSLGIPINPRQGMKIAFAASETNTDSGSSLDGVLIGWSMMFGQ